MRARSDRTARPRSMWSNESVHGDPCPLPSCARDHRSCRSELRAARRGQCVRAASGSGDQDLAAQATLGLSDFPADGSWDGRALEGADQTTQDNQDAALSAFPECATLRAAYRDLYAAPYAASLYAFKGESVADIAVVFKERARSDEVRRGLSLVDRQRSNSGHGGAEPRHFDFLTGGRGRHSRRPRRATSLRRPPGRPERDSTIAHPPSAAYVAPSPARAPANAPAARRGEVERSSDPRRHDCTRDA